MKALLLSVCVLLAVVANAQDIRRNETDEKTGKHVTETSIEALTKGFICRFRSVDGQKFIEVRIQKRGVYRISPTDTLYMLTTEGKRLKMPCVIGGTAERPIRQKAPGLKSLWVLFRVDEHTLEIMTKELVKSAYIGNGIEYIARDTDLDFSKIKTHPAQMFMTAAQLISKF